MNVVRTFNQWSFLICGLFFLGVGTTTFAQTDSVRNDLSLEELMNIDITTATKTSGKLDQAPAVLDVITGEQIRQRGYQHLAQVLNDISDNHEDRGNWGIGEPTNQNVGFGFRFDTGQNMLILFNGQRLNAFLPGNRFGGEEYLLNNIERIEIIRGPGSALYGTSAFTAVVNIISKKINSDKDENITAGAEYIPTSGGASVYSSVLTKVGNGSLSAAFRHFSEQGQELYVENALFGGRKLKDGVDYATDGEFYYSDGKLNLYSKFTKQQRKTFTGFNGVNPPDMDNLTLSMFAYSAGIDRTFKLGNRLDLKISGGWHKDNWTEVALIPAFKLNTAGDGLLLDANGQPVLDTLNLYRNGENIMTSFFIDGQGADTRSLDGEAQLTWNFAKSNNIILGAYIADDRVIRAERPSELNLDPFGYVPFRHIDDDVNNWLSDVNASRQTSAFYAQFDYNLLENLTVSGGARLDHYAGKGVMEKQKYQEFNPRGGIVYMHESMGTWKLLYGTATRVPNGFETLSTVAILGNPLNTPERLQATQFVWIQNWSSLLRTELGGFRTSISNRLETNAEISDELRALGFVGQYINRGENFKQINNGVDGKIAFLLNKVHAQVNFTQYFGSDDGTGNPIPYIPTTMVNADVNVPVGWLNVNAGFNYRGKFTHPEGDPRAPVKSYLVGRLNLVAAPPGIPFEFKVTGRNIFNTKYSAPSSSVDFTNHFPARKMEIVLGVSYRFN
jgi:iron complex outermembrane receptor protein